MVLQDILGRIINVIQTRYPIIAEVRQTTATEWINKSSEPLMPTALVSCFGSNYVQGSLTASVNIALLDYCGRDTEMHDIIASDMTNAAIDIYNLLLQYIPEIAEGNTLNINIIYNKYENCLSGTEFTFEVNIPYGGGGCF